MRILFCRYRLYADCSVKQLLFTYSLVSQFLKPFCCQSHNMDFVKNEKLSSQTVDTNSPSFRRSVFPRSVSAGTKLFVSSVIVRDGSWPACTVIYLEFISN